MISAPTAPRRHHPNTSKALERPHRRRTPAKWADLIRRRIHPDYQTWAACIIFFRYSDPAPSCSHSPYTLASWRQFRADMCQGPIDPTLSFATLCDQCRAFGITINDAPNVPKTITQPPDPLPDPIPDSNWFWDRRMIG